MQAVAAVKPIDVKKITSLIPLSRLQMKTAIAWHYRTKILLAPKRGYASCESKKCLPKGRQRAFHLLLKVSHIEEVLEAPRASGPVGWGSAETLLPLTLPHEGGRGEQRTRSILLELFLFLFFLK